MQIWNSQREKITDLFTNIKPMKKDKRLKTGVLKKWNLELNKTNKKLKLKKRLRESWDDLTLDVICSLKLPNSVLSDEIAETIYVIGERIFDFCFRGYHQLSFTSTNYMNNISFVLDSDLELDLSKIKNKYNSKLCNALCEQSLINLFRVHTDFLGNFKEFTYTHGISFKKRCHKKIAFACMTLDFETLKKYYFDYIGDKKFGNISEYYYHCISYFLDLFENNHLMKDEKNGEYFLYNENMKLLMIAIRGSFYFIVKYLWGLLDSNLQLFFLNKLQKTELIYDMSHDTHELSRIICFFWNLFDSKQKIVFANCNFDVILLALMERKSLHDQCINFINEYGHMFNCKHIMNFLNFNTHSHSEKSYYYLTTPLRHSHSILVNKFPNIYEIICLLKTKINYCKKCFDCFDEFSEFVAISEGIEKEKIGNKRKQNLCHVYNCKKQNVENLDYCEEHLFEKIEN